ncbi:hypothetical protein ACTHAM_000985 [Cellulomonas soli]|uniref:hypothetical protein n=1 Tax=Cellulomonas soli TaxID=931535 RepID=UPI003F87D534
MDEYMWVLKESEQDLVREIEPDRMGALDEDALIDLHRRVRRARNKHTTNYRRGGAKRVEEAGGRGAAGPKGGKARLRAEAFEEALSLVSARLAVVAHEQAEELKAQRLAQARAGRSTGPDSSPSSAGPVDGPGRVAGHQQTTGGAKRDASSASQGARRQAQRDSR